MKELQDLVWENREEIYKTLEKELDSITGDDQMKKFYGDVQLMQERIHNSKDDVDEAINTSLSYCADVLSNYESDEFQSNQTISEIA